MNVSFLEDDPLNTVVVNSADGQALYEVKTPWKLSGKTTTIRRLGPSHGSPRGDGQIVAQVHWHSWSQNKITFMDGNEIRMDEFLRKSNGFLSSSKVLTGSDGREYKWKHSSNKFTLFDRQTDAMVAQSHRKKFGIFSKARKMNIDILPQGMPNIDVVVVSFIIMEKKQREQSQAAANASAASSASASAAAAGS